MMMFFELFSLESVSPRLWVRVPLGNSDIFLGKNSSKNNNIYVRDSIHHPRVRDTSNTTDQLA